MNIQFTHVVDGRIHTHTSSDFDSLSEDKMDEFFDWSGDEDTDSELFWESDISANDDAMIVSFFTWPKDTQRIVDVIAEKLGISVVAFSEWHHSVDQL